MYKVLFYDWRGIFEVHSGFDTEEFARDYGQVRSIGYCMELGKKIRFRVKKA